MVLSKIKHMDNNELVATKQYNTKQSVTDTFTIS